MAKGKTSREGLEKALQKKNEQLQKNEKEHAELLVEKVKIQEEIAALPPA